MISIKTMNVFGGIPAQMTDVLLMEFTSVLWETVRN